jgi:HD-GYP domain-containing protein (c-di-GMP phosphodiesterase class II)
LSDVAKEVRYHQECYDGSGYPDGIKGNSIPLIARIIAVADAFDAMTSNRPYRKKKTVEEALFELKRCSGAQFDPVIVSAFLLAYEKGNIITNGTK